MISRRLHKSKSQMNMDRCIDPSCSILNPKVKKEISSLHNPDDQGILTALLENEILKDSPRKGTQISGAKNDTKSNDAINASNIIRDIKADSFKQLSLSQRSGACVKAQGDGIVEKKPADSEPGIDSRDDHERAQLLYQHVVQACRLAECRLQLEREKDKLSLERERAELQAERDRLNGIIEKERAIMGQDRERSLTLIHSEREPVMMPARHQVGSAEGLPENSSEDIRVDDLYRLMRGPEVSSTYDIPPGGDSTRGLLRTLVGELDRGLTDNILRELLGTPISTEDNKLKATRRARPFLQAKEFRGGFERGDNPSSGEAPATKSMCELINANLYTLHEKMCGMQQLILIISVIVIALGFAHIFNACGTLAWTAVLKK